jgi:hypothetical protein
MSARAFLWVRSRGQALPMFHVRNRAPPGRDLGDASASQRYAVARHGGYRETMTFLDSRRARRACTGRPARRPLAGVIRWHGAWRRNHCAHGRADGQGAPVQAPVSEKSGRLMNRDPADVDPAAAPRRVPGRGRVRIVRCHTPGRDAAAGRSHRACQPARGGRARRVAPTGSLARARFADGRARTALECRTYGCPAATWHEPGIGRVASDGV